MTDDFELSNSRDHHVVPQFFLRSFAVDEARTKIATVAKEGRMAIWKERSIKGLGFERDFYVHMIRGRPVSVESAINKFVETPISRSDTWAKISSGRSDLLDRTDRPILYALVRHLEVRTPHYLDTGRRLANKARDPLSNMPFSAEEREHYARERANPDLAREMFNLMSTNPFDEYEYDRALIIVGRSPISLRTSTAPTIAVPTMSHPAIDLPLPGMLPFQRILNVNSRTMVSIVVGDFGGHFQNVELELDAAMGLNRSFAAHFAKFRHVRHLVSGRDRLVDDMLWAPYELVSDTPRKLIFRRND